MLTTWGKLYLILLGSVLLASCATATGMQAGNLFMSARDDFSQRLRWQDYQGAARYLPVEARSAFLEQFVGQEDLRFVAVEPVSADMGDQNQHAETLTVLEYYRLPSVVVRKYRLRQKWTFKDGVWQIDSPFPELP
jgi:hypothetical protein